MDRMPKVYVGMTELEARVFERLLRDRSKPIVLSYDERAVAGRLRRRLVKALERRGWR